MTDLQALSDAATEAVRLAEADEMLGSSDVHRGMDRHGVYLRWNRDGAEPVYLAPVIRELAATPVVPAGGLREAAQDLIRAMDEGFMGSANFYFGPSARTLSDPKKYNRVKAAMDLVRAALAASPSPATDRAIEPTALIDPVVGYDAASSVPDTGLVGSVEWVAAMSKGRTLAELVAAARLEDASSPATDREDSE